MIKLADEGRGSFAAGRLEKSLTEADGRRLAAAAAVCAELFARLGIPERALFRGLLNAGHPGGMFPLTAADARTLRPAGLPENAYIADASLLPAALGRPPILTILALAGAVARKVIAIKDGNHG
jgi:choline dehydrogenase-like flavoprotein